MRREIDMLNGGLAAKILQFAIPLALTGILQQFFNAADVMVVGRFASKFAMAAVGCNTPVIGIVVNLFVGISTGATVVIARCIGKGDRNGVKKAVHTAVFLSLVCGSAMALVALAVSSRIMSLLSVPEEVLPMALSYFRIYISGLPAILLYNFESAIFRSKGDTNTPLFCLIAAGIVNVLLNLFFVLVLKMGAEGVAIATVISNILSSGAMFIVLLRSKSDVGIEFHLIRADHASLLEILRIGVPAGVQSMVFALSNIIIQSAINSLGADVMAASAAAFNTEIFVYFIVNAFSQACTAFIGQNYGAGKLDRCRKVTIHAFWMDCVFMFALALPIIIFSRELLSLFNGDPAVIEYGRTRILYITSFQILNLSVDIMSGSLRGYGNSLAPALIALLGICVTRVIWVFTFFTMNRTYSNLLACYPISWSITATIMLCYYFWFMRVALKRKSGGSTR